MSVEEYQKAASVASISGETVPPDRALSTNELAGLLQPCEREPLGLYDAALLSWLYGYELRRLEPVALGDYFKVCAK